MTFSYPPELPISARADEVVEMIRAHQVLIVAGDTGSGKTTQLPKMCLQAGRGNEKMIACTQPRRIAATSVAARVEAELGEAGAGLVGHKIRFSDRTSKSTRIKFMTDGMLLAELHGDRNLVAYDTIIIDEAHERSLNIDFLLGILRRLIVSRPDLKLIITSATIDTEKFSRSFGNAPIIAIAGRAYPVEVRYQPPQADGEEVSYLDQAVAATLDLHRLEDGGDILVFLPTEQDIRETVDTLQAATAKGDFRRQAVILPLFGRLSASDQNRVFAPVSGRKIVVASNVAETSLTVPGIRFVVDSGLARISAYSPRSGSTRLPVARISRAGCDQRKGRCGRVGPGVCVRLYSEDDYLSRPEFTPPEVLRTNLAEVIVRMLWHRLGDPRQFPFIDPPPPRMISDGYAILQELGAIRPAEKGKGWRLTDDGRLMARLPLDPRIGRMVIEGRRQGCLAEIMVLAAALSIQDPRMRPASREKEADAAHARFAAPGSDFLAFLNIWRAYGELVASGAGQSKQRAFCRDSFLSWQRMREWRDIHAQIRLEMGEEKGFAENETEASADSIHQAVLAGHLRHIALKKEKNLYLAARDRECMIFPGSSLFGKAGQWVVAAEMVETSRLYARCVANIKPEWIEPLAAGLCRASHGEPHWEKKEGRVMAWEKVSLFGLVIVARRKVDFGKVNPAEAREIFIQSALVEGEIIGNYPFLEHNRQLLEELAALEDRLRVRDIVVDEYAIYSFYNERLPANVCDQPSLVRWLRVERNGERLCLTREEMTGRPPDPDEMEKFPESAEAGGHLFDLCYRFEPGAEDDGVTARVPVDLAGEVPGADFEWLVPGLLREKIVFLLKGLPKSLRRQLVPVPDTAAALVRRLPFGKGSLYAALEREILARYGVRIKRSDWPLDELPGHLKMRFVLDAGGKELASGRDLVSLAAAVPASGGREENLAVLRGRYERASVVDWDFDGLPERLPVSDSTGRLIGYCYPALAVSEDGAVSLRLVSSRPESRELTRKGLCALYRRHFAEAWRTVVRDLALSRSQWPLYEGLASHGEINRQLAEFVLETVFGTRSSRIPAREEFAAKVAEVRQQGLYPLCMAAREEIVNVLRHRRETLHLIGDYEKRGGIAAACRDRFKALRAEVAELVPPDFLSRDDDALFAHAPRYFRAIQLRLERMVVDPGKDARKAAQLAPHEERLARCLRASGEFAEERETLVAEYRRMIAEFRVSLFAQELKTAFAVSAKRLEEKWRELEALFRG